MWWCFVGGWGWVSMVTKWFENNSEGAVKNEKLKQTCEILTNE